MAHASTTLTTQTERVADSAHDAVQDASPALVALGRFGFTCKGVVYVLIGLLAGRAALAGAPGEATDSQTAMQHLAGAPFGPLLLIAVACGLAGYATWRVIQAAFDTEHKGNEPKGLWVRGGYLVSAGIHLALTWSAVQLLRGSGGAGGEQAAQDWTGRFMEQPFGPWLVAGVGVALIGTAGFQGYRAYCTDFRKRLRLDQADHNVQQMAVLAGRLGYAARAVTFGIMGLFLVLAAFRHEPGEAKGLAGALATLAQQPFGTALVAIVAVGLAAYGLYMFVEARYRRMVVS